MIDLAERVNRMILEDAPTDELIRVCSVIDFNSCYSPIVTPPQEVLDQWSRFWEKPDPFTGTVERKIGNTLYVIETECEGAEPLSDKIKRLIFSHKEAI